MAKCGYCNSTILFGGVQEGDLRFCNENCHQGGFRLTVASQVPDNVLEQQVWTIHQGTCPNCQGNGPIDVHTSHRVWSALVTTSWRSTPRVSCRSCGVKSQLGDTAFSLVLGWWGLPWGLVMTPVQVSRNLLAMARPPETSQPSAELTKLVRIEIAAQAVANQASGEQDA